MKQRLKKILKKMGLLKSAQEFQLACRRIRYRLQTLWYAREYAPLFGKNRLVVTYFYRKKENISTSQYGQEVFICDHFMQDKEGGFFVEIGANDPIKLSNTLYLEKKGWSGISFEPIDAMQSKWKDTRKTPCFPILIGDREELVDFCEIPGDSSVLSSVSGYGRSIEGLSSSPQILKKQMRKLNTVLDEHNIKHVDILFVDVEGFEQNVIRSIDFQHTTIDLLVVENPGDHYSNAKELRNLIIKNGYILKAHIGGDDIFIRKG